MKRFLSLLLCLVMVMSLFTGMVVVNAEGYLADIDAVVFEILLHLSAHHLINLSGMLRLNEQIGELVNLEQTVCIRTICSPKLIVPEYLPVILSP